GPIRVIMKVERAKKYDDLNSANGGYTAEEFSVERIYEENANAPHSWQNQLTFRAMIMKWTCLMLWQDSQHRVTLNTVLKKHYELRPTALTVDDKLKVLGCKDLERRIVETEMKLAQAKSQGYLKNQKSLSSSSGKKKMFAVIGVYTCFGSHLKRNRIRGSWMPQDDALKKLEERGVVIPFVIGRRWLLLWISKTKPQDSKQCSRIFKTSAYKRALPWNLTAASVLTPFAFSKLQEQPVLAAHYASFQMEDGYLVRHHTKLDGGRKVY
ncbi:unnamed protein product, partial [Eruca vesicaria subsp. sativa]|nr:unnamed protein product [Eruca vesicaria subsp. sativa]